MSGATDSRPPRFESLSPDSGVQGFGLPVVMRSSSLSAAQALSETGFLGLEIAAQAENAFLHIGRIRGVVWGGFTSVTLTVVIIHRIIPTSRT